MNEWLRRRAENTKRVFSQYLWYDKSVISKTADVRELQKGMRVTIWVNAAHGRHHIIGALPFEEVINHHFADDTMVNGFSIWLDDREILWQRLGWFRTGVTIPSGGSLEINMKSLNMELMPFTLS